MDFNYGTIKELAKQTGCRVTDLIALAAQNDPFYTGTPGEVTLAEWFADFYDRHFAPGTRVHVRRCHYKILSLELFLPNGKPYENTEECWGTLLLATKAARYLKLVDVSAFEDRKNDDPADFTVEANDDAEIGTQSSLYDLELPSFPELPRYEVYDYKASQPYHMELWCEKTTMNDILLPLCQEYNMVLQTGAGELSITATKALAERIVRCGKPARIFYISDYDPAGQSMPVAVARKLEFFMRSENVDADVRLFPVVLTADQCSHYHLPRTPIKESERRKESFEARHGTGATELDALEALRPGELEHILRGYIESYYDITLDRRTRQARRDLECDLSDIRDGVLSRYEEQIQASRQELEAIQADISSRFQVYRRRLEDVWQAIDEDLQNERPDIDDYPFPEASEATEIAPGLYNSERNYLEQIDSYKLFQGK